MINAQLSYDKAGQDGTRGWREEKKEKRPRYGPMKIVKALEEVGDVEEA
jgi:hypothetical protein